MNRAIFLFGLVACAVGCAPKNVAANLSFIKISQTPIEFILEFDSDIDIENLYSKDKEIIVKKLMCALGDDQSFDVRHKMRYVFRGTLALQSGPMAGQTGNHRYESRGDFYENPPESNGVKLLRGDTLAKVIGEKKSVPCKVIMTIYMTSPYYSGVMLVPARDILEASKTVQN